MGPTWLECGFGKCIRNGIAMNLSTAIRQAGLILSPAGGNLFAINGDTNPRLIASMFVEKQARRTTNNQTYHFLFDG